jgi:hypothetical protein
MKSLAVFGFIFLLAASANAGLMISVNGVIQPPLGEVVLQPGDTAVIGIHGDGLTPSPIAPYLLVEGPGSIDGYTILYPGGLSSYIDWPLPYWPLDNVQIVPPDDLLDEFRDFLGMPELMDFSFIVLANGALPPPLEGLLIDDIIYCCDGLGDVTLTLIGDDFATVYDTQIIQQVPEPMALLLLGLGGLFLAAGRRRKRQS